MKRHQQPKKQSEDQLAFDFERKINGVMRAFERDVVRNGPKSVARELGLTRVTPHWRKIGGGR